MSWRLWLRQGNEKNAEARPRGGPLVLLDEGAGEVEFAVFVHEAGAIPVDFHNEIAISGCETGGLELRPI